MIKRLMRYSKIIKYFIYIIIIINLIITNGNLTESIIGIITALPIEIVEAEGDYVETDIKSSIEEDNKNSTKENQGWTRDQIIGATLMTIGALIILWAICNWPEAASSTSTPTFDLDPEEVWREWNNPDFGGWVTHVEEMFINMPYEEEVTVGYGYFLQYVVATLPGESQVEIMRNLQNYDFFVVRGVKYNVLWD